MFLLGVSNIISDELREAFNPLKESIWKITWLSLVINMLMLCPTWYMLEIYSRVITSRNHNTLLMLTILIGGIYFLLEAMVYIRSRLMYVIAKKFESSLRESIFNSIFQTKIKQKNFSNIQGFLDLRTIQDLQVSPVLTALIDMPFSILTLIIIFIYDPFLGWLSLVGLLALCLIAYFNFMQVEPPLSKANLNYIDGQRYANDIIKNAQVIESMGMMKGVHDKWLHKHHKFLSLHSQASYRSASSASASRLLQIMQGSLTIGLGSWLVISGLLMGGSSEIIVNSMLASRALAPIVIVVGLMRVLIGGFDAIKRLDVMLKGYTKPLKTMPLPVPIGNLQVDSVSLTVPGSNQLILSGLSLNISAGRTLALMGPSASGKTSLARLLTGVWQPSAGSVRLDGVDIHSWNKEELGPFVGYLPQDIELFEGTIAENISRFSEPDIIKIEEAAKLVGIHDFICALEKRYDQHISDDAINLSGGQRQRIALARAFYDNPKFIVLDEPNSNLDEVGENALINAIKSMQSKGSTIIVITHRPKIIMNLDFMAIIGDRKIKIFGPTLETLKKIQITSKEPNKKRALTS